MKKTLKRLMAFALAAVMMLAMTATAFAAQSASSDGKITITNAKEKQTYSIYRIFDLESSSGDAYSYTLSAKWKGFAASDFFTVENGYVVWNEGKSSEVAEFAKLAFEYAETNGVAADDTKTAAEGVNTVVFDGLLLGYYLVDSTTGALCSLNTANTDITIEDKNDVPEVEKTVKEDSTGNFGESNTASVGDVIEFEATVTVKAGAENYVLHDKMSEGLTFSKEVAVWKDDVEVDSSKYDFIVDPSDDCTFEVAFHEDFINTLTVPAKLVVKYTATVNEKAIIGDNGNINEVKLGYGEDKETTTDTTTTYTYEIKVFKYAKDKDENGVEIEKALAGAVFTLSEAEDGSNPISMTQKKDESGVVVSEYQVDPKGTITEITTPEDGKFKIEGLDAGTYYLTEITPPTGYNKLSGPVTITIEEDGKVTSIGEDGATVPADNELGIKIENKTGAILPSTGGIGTTIFYIVGILVMAGAVFFFAMSRKKKEE